MKNKFNYSLVSGAGVSIISLLLSPVRQYFSSLLIGDEKSSEPWVQAGRALLFRWCNIHDVSCGTSMVELHNPLHHPPPSGEWCLENNFYTLGVGAVVCGSEVETHKLSGWTKKGFFYATIPCSSDSKSLQIVNFIILKYILSSALSINSL